MSFPLKDHFNGIHPKISKKKNKGLSKENTIVLAIFLGFLGGHRFYLKQYGYGMVYLLLCWTFIPLGLSILDAMVIGIRSEDDFNHRYNRGNSSSTDYTKSAISLPFISLAREMNQETLNTLETLYTDEQMIEKLSNIADIDTSAEELIKICFTYDMLKIAETMLPKNKLNADEALVTGVSLMVIDLIDPNHGLWKYSNEVLQQLHQDGGFRDINQAVLNILNFNNPLNINYSIGEDESQQSKSNFALPPMMQLTQNDCLLPYATTLHRSAIIIAKFDDHVSQKEEKLLDRIYQEIHNPIPSFKKDYEVYERKQKKSSTLEKKNLKAALKELNSLIALSDVKEEINTLVNFVKIQKQREDEGLKTADLSYHVVFTGNPGTGKTTVARLLAEIYRELGVLEKGHLIETDRSGLIAEYAGQTAVKVNKVVDQALDGVLFIDEAYALVGENQDNYGKEAVATLIKRIEDDRDRLVVILAGYSDEMKTFIDTNPGFQSRINRYIHFKDYEPAELMDIFKLFCKKAQYTLSSAAEEGIKQYLTDVFQQRDKNFGNGRTVRNTFEQTLENQANRLSKTSEINKDLLITLELEDVPTA